MLAATIFEFSEFPLDVPKERHVLRVFSRYRHLELMLHISYLQKQTNSVALVCK
jgi:hypothetical protein